MSVRHPENLEEAHAKVSRIQDMIGAIEGKLAGSGYISSRARARLEHKLGRLKKEDLPVAESALERLKEEALVPA